MMILDEGAVRGLLRMEELIPAMERALADLSSGKVVQPRADDGAGRRAPGVPRHDARLRRRALGVKLVAFYPNNQGIPTHHAGIQLFKPDTGEPLVLMDGRLITEERTAAVSAVATKHLARPDASVLALIGSGVQARSHLKALGLLREFRDVRVWSPRRAADLAREFGGRATPSAAANQRTRSRCSSLSAWPSRTS